jgi:hypothetical protein
VALAFVLSTVLLTACGSSSSSTGSTATTTYPPLRPPTTTTTHQQPAPAGPPVGRTQRVDAPGTVLSVTISRVIDPLGGSGASLPPGTRAIGVEAVIADDGPGVYDSSSTGDFSVLTSKGVAPPVYAASGVCQTPLRDWDNEISPGETRNGCIAYSVPAHANVLEVRFSPHALAHGRVAWAVH